MAVLSACLSCAAFAQTGLGFLKDAPVAYLSEDDLKMMQDAAGEALNSGEPHAARDWHNPASGSSGKVKIVASFGTDDSRECERMRFESHTTRGGDSRVMMNVCRSPGGRWLMDPDARPAGTVSQH